MGDTVFYMRRSSPDGLKPILDDRVVEDLRSFVAIDIPSFSAIIKSMSNSGLFVKHTELKKVLEDTLGVEKATPVSRVIRHLHRIETDGPGLSTFLEQLEQLTTVERDDNSSELVFQPDQLALLIERIAQLKENWLCLDRQSKANELSKVTGRRLLSVQLICDLRPIFNNKRKSVDGLLPITTMHLVTEGADGLPDSIDVLLSAADVKALTEASSFAEDKLQGLRSLAGQLEIPIPSTEITEEPRPDDDSI